MCVLWRSQCRSECPATELRCCPCQGAHPANYSNCPTRAQESSVLEIIEKRRCSRGEAIAAVKQRACGYASVASRQGSVNEQSLSALMNASVVNSMTSIVQPPIGSLIECMCQMEAMTLKMSEILQMFSAMSPCCQLPHAGVASIAGASSGQPHTVTNVGLATASTSTSGHVTP